MKYSVIVERSLEGFAAYIPDLPGCVAAGDTKAEVVSLIQEAIGFRIEGLREGGQEVSTPSTTIEVIEVAA